MTSLCSKFWESRLVSYKKVSYKKKQSVPPIYLRLAHLVAGRCKRGLLVFYLQYIHYSVLTCGILIRTMILGDLQKIGWIKIFTADCHSEQLSAVALLFCCSLGNHFYLLCSATSDCLWKQICTNMCTKNKCWQNLT